MPRLVLLFATIIALLAPAQQQLPSIVGTPRFVSLEGKFSIALPERNGFAGLSFPTPFGAAKGDLYRWQTKEGTFGVGYADAFQPLTDPENSKQVFNEAIESFKELASSNSANVAEVKQITIGNNPG